MGEFNGEWRVDNGERRAVAVRKSVSLTTLGTLASLACSRYLRRKAKVPFTS